MRQLLLCTTLTFSTVLSGCDVFAPAETCTLLIERAIEVRVVDATTGAYIADGAEGWARENGFEERLQVIGWEGAVATTLGGVDERPGRYDLEVRKPGYHPWVQRDVRVPKTSCGVKTAQLTARLQPVP